MFSLGLALICLQSPNPTAPFERFLDPSGATVLYFPSPELATVRLHCFASTRGTPETPKTHGFRHLLEHVLVRQDGRFDLALETSGWFLNASTFRDVIEIRLEGGASGFAAACRVLGQVLATREFSETHLSRESKIIAQEIALQDEPALALSRNWQAVYADEGLDPLGSISAIQSAQPSDLLKTFREVFAADQLVFAVTGPVSKELVRAGVTEIARQAPPARGRALEKRTSAADRWSLDKVGSTVTFSVGVERYSATQTAQVLAILCAWADALPRFKLTYVPSLQPGLASIQFEASSFDPVSELAKLSDEQLLAGLDRAKRTIREELADPRSAAIARGFLQTQAVGAKPEALLEALDGVTVSGLRSRIALLSPAPVRAN